MPVLTHARPATRATTYDQLSPFRKSLFDAAIADALDAAEAADATGYNHAMQRAAQAAGLAIPTGGEVTKCACLLCYCTAIFDTSGPGLRVVETTDYGLVLHQCADCTDAHPAPVED
ncbi:hypothetical protein [Streptomyces cinereoruber]|uniref:hypothetical protein n=1 Tax=Streptomyces cinereoruber TaxID=67260 RepID=UPI00363F9EB2